MKKIIYSLFLALVGMAALTACSSDDHDYTWATTSGEQVYFSKDLASVLNISNKENSFTVPVNRVNTKGSVDVPLTLTSEDNFLSAPSSVSFADGQATTYVTLSYDPEALVYDKFQEATLSIAGEQLTNEYGASSYTFKAGVPSPFKTLGTGKYEETYMWGVAGSVTVAQNTEQTNVFRVYGMNFANEEGAERASEYMEITVCKPGDTFRGVTVTQEDLVFFSDFNSGYFNTSNNYNQDIMLYHPSAFTNTNPEEFWLHNRVLAYQEDGTPGQIQIAPRYYMEGLGGWNQSQADGILIITFPGYEPKDYSAAYACTGVFTDLTGSVFAEGILELGADAKDVRAVVVSADADADAVADAIAAGELEATAVEAGHIYVPIPEDQTGKLQVVVVVLDEEKAIQGVYSSPFEYYGGGANPWVSLGKGLYTEDFVSSVFGVDPITYEVEIEENTEHPGLYRMLSPYDEDYAYNEEGDWDASTVYNVEVNAEDPEGVYIPVQDIGMDWGYGPMAIVSWGAYYMDKYSMEELKAEGYMGTLKDGVITLPVFEREASDGSTALYQGLLYMGSSGYYACSNGAFKLVLPEAVSASARAKAKSMKRAISFEKKLKKHVASKGFGMKQLRIQANRKAPVQAAEKIKE